MPPVSAEAQCWWAALAPASTKASPYNPWLDTKISKFWREIFTTPSGCQNLAPEPPPSSTPPPVTSALPRLPERYHGPLLDAAVLPKRCHRPRPPLNRRPPGAPSSVTRAPPRLPEHRRGPLPDVASSSMLPPSRTTAAGHPSASSPPGVLPWPPRRRCLLPDAAALPERYCRPRPHLHRGSASLS